MSELHPSPNELSAAVETARRRGWNQDDITLAGWIAHVASRLELLEHQMLWQIGDADPFASALRDFVTWARCDLRENGEGPAHGYALRLEKAEWALERGLALLQMLRMSVPPADRPGG